MKSKRVLLSGLIGLCIIVASTFCVAKDTRLLEYKPYNQVLHYVANNLKSKHLQFDSRLINHRNKAVKIHLLKNGETQSKIGVLQDNHVSLPLYSEAEAQQYQLRFNIPDKDIYLFLYLSFKMLPQEIGYDELFVALEDKNAIKHIMGGKDTWFNPDFDKLWFRFDQPSTITLKNENLENVLSSNDGDIMLHLDPKILGTNTFIAFSHIPSAVLALN